MSGRHRTDRVPGVLDLATVTVAVETAERGQVMVVLDDGVEVVELRSSGRTRAQVQHELLAVVVALATLVEQVPAPLVLDDARAGSTPVQA